MTDQISIPEAIERLRNLAPQIGEIAAGIIERLAEQNDKYRWQVRDTCTRAEKAEAEVKRLTAENEALRADKDRLDLLDRLHAVLNRHYGTNYGWRIIVNHNVVRLYFSNGAHDMQVDVSDFHPYGTNSCREAIDEWRRQHLPARPSGGEG